MTNSPQTLDVDTAKLIVAGVMTAFALVELAAGRFLHRDTTTRKDVIIDIASALVLPLLIVPAVFWAAGMLVETVAPGSAGAWASLSPVAMFAILLVADDMTQYWWHRLSHTSWLYPLHRAHHSAGYLSVRVVYRNNVIYYALMPGLWFSGALLHLGFGPVYVVYLIAKMSTIIAAHSSVPWDEKLLRWRVTRPLMWVVERVFSTPATHSAHHGLHADDGVTHYRGNYGNFLFLWDVLFGTAKITRRRPEAFGIEGLAPASTFEELIWPFRRRQSTSTASRVVSEVG